MVLLGFRSPVLLTMSDQIAVPVRGLSQSLAPGFGVVGAQKAVQSLAEPGIV